MMGWLREFYTPLIGAELGDLLLLLLTVTAFGLSADAKVVDGFVDGFEVDIEVAP